MGKQLWRRAAIAVLVLSAVGGAMAACSSDGPVGQAAGSTTASRAADDPATTVPATTVPDAHEHDAQLASGGTLGSGFESPHDAPFEAEDLPSDQVTPPPSNGLYGWGAWMPAQMARPLVGGVAKKPLTPERRALLGRQLVQAREAALKVGTVAEAEAAGYRQLHPYLQGRGIEFANFDYIDSTLDIDHPEILAFPDDEPETGIMAVAYYVLGDKAEPPQTFPTEAIPWHSHWANCQKDGSWILSQSVKGCEAKGGKVDSSLDGWMVDLWLIPGWENPWGLVSSKHPDLFTPKDATS